MLRSDEYEVTPLLRSGRFRKGWCVQSGHLMLFAVLMLLAAPPEIAFGATFRIVPSANVTESYTDNVRAVSEGAEADLITETQAGANFSANGNRLDLNLDLTGINERHLDTNGLNSTRPQILGVGNVELLEDRFFIDSSVSMSETSTLRGGAVSARNRSLPTNRTRLLVFDVAPRYEQRLGRWLEATLQYNYSESRYSKPSAGITGPAAPGLSPVTSIGNQKTGRTSLLLDTGQAFSRTTSQLNLTSESSDRGNRTTLNTGAGKLKEKRADLVNEYKLNRHIGLIARAGYEEIKDPNQSFNNSGPTGALGVHLTPGPRLDLRTEYGRKYNKPNLSANLIYKISSFYVLNASFDQRVTTQQAGRLNRLNRLITGPDGALIDPFTGIPADPSFSGFDLSNSTFREDSFELGFTGVRGRNTVSFGADLSSRDSGNQPPGSGGKEERLNVNLDLSRRLQPLLTGKLALSYSDTLTSRTGSAADTRYTGDAGLNYRLGEIFTSDFGYTYFKRDFKTGGGTAENVVSIGLNAEF